MVSPALQWPVTLALVAVTAFHGFRMLDPTARRTGPGPAVRFRVSGAVHVLMGVAITAMVWALGVPPVVWLVLFAPAGAWYAMLTARRPSRPGSRAVTGYFALASGAMVWMSGLPGDHAGPHGGVAPVGWWSGAGQTSPARPHRRAGDPPAWPLV
ncbi:DUF5134 domain-containing protein [Micromonospora sp. KC207]|uniref:DUF5134 domain-containing protein n=1 Tax=Micromonospora sp. KC207 TaxID=2530377 RepID=UPI00104E35B2|nr:DUF5134 domain-containing protein [Micromonospora sp. KC207]